MGLPAGRGERDEALKPFSIKGSANLVKRAFLRWSFFFQEIFIEDFYIVGFHLPLKTNKRTDKMVVLPFKEDYNACLSNEDKRIQDPP